MGTHEWAAALLLGTGFIGIAATMQKNVAYSFRSEISTLNGSHLWYRIDGGLPALPPAVRAGLGTHPRRALAA